MLIQYINLSNVVVEYRFCNLAKEENGIIISNIKQNVKSSFETWFQRQRYYSKLKVTDLTVKTTFIISKFNLTSTNQSLMLN